VIGPVVRRLIVKDWYLYRGLILFTILGGAIALALSQQRSEPAVVVGAVCFFIALIMAAHMLPLTSIMNERKNRTLAFVMSFPVSAIEYTTAKLIANLAMFLIPWLTLVSIALLVIETRTWIPRGIIPIALILAFFPFIGFSLITAAALVGESEGWGIAANVVCSSSYGLVWYFFTRVPALMGNANKPAPVWNSAALTVLGSEFALVLLILGVAFYLQSRKRDFV
jgi:ABC-2 type transport system permease protein